MEIKTSQNLFPAFWEIPNPVGIFSLANHPEPSAIKIFKPMPVNGFRHFKKVKKKSGTPVGYIPEQTKSMNKMIGKKEFKIEVVESLHLSLVQFKTEWNGASQIVSMIYEDLAKSYKGSANFFTVDAEKEIHLGKEYGINEIPTILFFKSGKVIDYASGLIPKNVLITKIENALSSSKN
jgi:thioredoxin 1